MRTIIYENAKGDTRNVKTARTFPYGDDRRVKWTNKRVNARTTRQPTMAEADEKMRGEGFYRRAA